MPVIPFASPVLQVRDLTVSLADGTDVVADIGFAVHPGEIVAVVGESGSGKTSIATALLGEARPGAFISRGAVLIDGQDMLTMSPSELERTRGALIAYMPQDPGLALNPMQRIGDMLAEMAHAHEPALTAAERAARIGTTMADVGLPASIEFLRRFPHQLSGGQQQRVLLALAILLRPRLIVLDEPTTALDVSTQARVLDSLRTLCRQRDMAAVYVSHDLAVVRELADRVVVLYAGRIAEAGPRDSIFARPRHPYTRGLLDAVPDIGTDAPPRAIAGHAPGLHERPAGCAFAPRCARRTDLCAQRPMLAAAGDRHAVACHHPLATMFHGSPPATAATLATGQDNLLTVRDLSARYGAIPVLQGIDLDLPRGLCTALVGESGSGKTTLARAIVGLGGDVGGTLTYDGLPLSLSSRRPLALKRRIQYVFQNPYRALNPRQTVGDILRTAVRHFFALSSAAADARVARVLARVALPPALAWRYPGELSGGERQRVAIARALICEPELLICDEITSALDVSVQAAILELLRGLQQDHGLTMLFVTHNLGVVRTIADRTAVLNRGRIMEYGPTAQILDAPRDAYTRTLVADSPRLHVFAAH